MIFRPWSESNIRRKHSSGPALLFHMGIETHPAQSLMFVQYNDMHEEAKDVERRAAP